MNDATYEKVRRAKKIYRDRVHDVQQDRIEALRRRRKIVKSGCFVDEDDLNHQGTLH